MDSVDETLKASIRTRSELIKAELAKIETAVNWATATGEPTWGTAGDLGQALSMVREVSTFLRSARHG